MIETEMQEIRLEVFGEFMERIHRNHLAYEGKGIRLVDDVRNGSLLMGRYHFRNCVISIGYDHSCGWTKFDVLSPHNVSLDKVEEEFWEAISR